MSSQRLYVLDANVFIEAKKRYYAFDLVPRFWEALVELASSGHVLSIDRVRHELEKQNDELTEWARGDFHSWFVSTNESDVLTAYAHLMQWAQAQSQYSDAAKAEFAKTENADAWLVAYASARGCVVATHEQPDSTSRRRIKIPDVCIAFQVPFIDPFEMLRALGVRLS